MNRSYLPFRDVVASTSLTRVAGAHSALGGHVAQEAGFDAVWASSFEVSASRCLPDASLLTMTEYLEASANVQKALSIPVVADCDTGFGGVMNVAHMVREYERAGITAVCMEDKIFPKMNSFVAADHTLMSIPEFARKIEVAKKVQRTDDFFVIARTEAMISGLGVDEALKRCHAYVDAGADAVLVHSKQRTNAQILEFLAVWDKSTPVVLVPTTYPDWHVDDMRVAGASVVIYANQGLRATVSSLRATFRAIQDAGHSAGLEADIAEVADIFALQHLDEWQGLGA